MAPKRNDDPNVVLEALPWRSPLWKLSIGRAEEGNGMRDVVGSHFWRGASIWFARNVLTSMRASGKLRVTDCYYGLYGHDILTPIQPDVMNLGRSEGTT